MLQEQSSGSVKILSINRDKLVTRLVEISQVICRAHPEVHSIHLFGSLARADHVGTSDVDILIVLFEPDDADPPVLIGKYYPYFDLPISTDLVVIDQLTLEKRLAGDDPWIRKTWGEKITLTSNLNPGG